MAVNDFDNIVVKIAKDLAEDIPAADPRWEDISNSKYALGSSTSMQIIQQLREKHRAFGHFIEFLQATGLWQKVSIFLAKFASSSFSCILFPKFKY